MVEVCYNGVVYVVSFITVLHGDVWNVVCDLWKYGLL